MITRIAPTPSGFLHQGNLYNFILNWLWARSHGGKVLLRIDDADAERKRPEYLDDIFRVLEYLGLDWDIGPSGPDDFEKNWSQQTRRDLYESVLDELVAKQRVYACTCSRTSRQVISTTGACSCRGQLTELHTGHTAWRIKTQEQDIVEIRDYTAGTIRHSVSDCIVRKKDGTASYQVTSVADDRYFGVTHIARGKDLVESTALQLYIDECLDSNWLQEALFWHHPLLLNQNLEKLSKSAGQQASSILNSISKGELLTAFAEWMQWNTERYRTLDDMIHYPDFVI